MNLSDLQEEMKIPSASSEERGRTSESQEAESEIITSTVEHSGTTQELTLLAIHFVIKNSEWNQTISR